RVGHAEGFRRSLCPSVIEAAVLDGAYRLWDAEAGGVCGLGEGLRPVTTVVGVPSQDYLTVCVRSGVVRPGGGQRVDGGEWCVVRYGGKRWSGEFLWQRRVRMGQVNDELVAADLEAADRGSALAEASLADDVGDREVGGWVDDLECPLDRVQHRLCRDCLTG